MEDPLTRNRLAARKYYEKNACKIIKTKTLRKVRLHGRCPRQSTMEKNSISLEEVEDAMRTYLSVPTQKNGPENLSPECAVDDQNDARGTIRRTRSKPGGE